MNATLHAGGPWTVQQHEGAVVYRQSRRLHNRRTGERREFHQTVRVHAGREPHMPPMVHVGVDGQTFLTLPGLEIIIADAKQRLAAELAAFRASY